MMDSAKDYLSTIFLRTLMLTPSPSGYEEKALSLFEEQVKSYFDGEAVRDKFGNVYFKAGHGGIKVLLSGHIDEVSAVVTNISDDGMIAFAQSGGIDKKDLIASKVLLLDDNTNPIQGLVIKLPIHLEHAEKKIDKVTEFDELRIDVGCETKKEVLDLGIHPGTPIVYDRNANLNFGQNRMCGTGLDDKIGVFVAEEIFRDIVNPKHFPRDWENKYTVYCLAATQEEVGCRSVCVAARKINPDISIDFDVTFATDGDLGINKNKYGDVCLGKGPVISYGAEKSLRLNRILKESSSFVQEVASGRAGGTNTSNIQIFSEDCETTLVSIPNRSMHTRVEVCDWRDVQGAVDMVSHAIMLNML